MTNSSLAFVTSPGDTNRTFRVLDGGRAVKHERPPKPANRDTVLKQLFAVPQAECFSGIRLQEVKSVPVGAIKKLEITGNSISTKDVFHNGVLLTAALEHATRQNKILFPRQELKLDQVDYHSLLPVKRGEVLTLEILEAKFKGGRDIKTETSFIVKNAEGETVGQLKLNFKSNKAFTDMPGNNFLSQQATLLDTYRMNTLSPLSRHSARARAATSDHPFSKGIGLRIVDCRPGSAQSELVVEDRHLCFNNQVHQGVLLTAIDSTFTASARTLLKKDRVPVINGMDYSSLGTASKGDKLAITAGVINQDSPSPTLLAKVTNQKGNLIGFATGKMSVKYKGSK